MKHIMNQNSYLNNDSQLTYPHPPPTGRLSWTVPYGETMTRTDDRRSRRREQTRERLINAARGLMAERGFTEVGIAEITAAADLGTGTFYNYFPSREHLLAAVAEDSMEKVGDALDRQVSGLADPAEAFAGSLRHLVRHALTDRVWGGFLVQMGAAHPALLRILGPRAQRDLLRGVETGRFSIEDLDLATTCTFGSLVAAIQLAMESEHRGEADQLFARAMLRMVGVPADEATEVAARELPEIEV